MEKSRISAIIGPVIHKHYEEANKTKTFRVTFVAITLLLLMFGCTPFPCCCIVPHPIRGQRTLLVKLEDVYKEDFIEFYVLYTQAYGMEHKYRDLDCASALYLEAAKCKSTYIKPDDKSAVESRVAELQEKISAESQRMNK